MTNAVVEIRKHEPAGVFKQIWYSVDYDCHGCWHRCGGGTPLRTVDELDDYVKRQVASIRKCKEWRGKPHIQIKDLRKIQVQATLF